MPEDKVPIRKRKTSRQLRRPLFAAVLMSNAVTIPSAITTAAVVTAISTIAMFAAGSQTARAQTGPYVGGSNKALPVVRSSRIITWGPDEVQLLVINGTNFSPYKEDITVTIDGVQARVYKAEINTIVTDIPPSIKEGDCELAVTVRGQQPVKSKQHIQIPPQITGMNLMSGPPGLPITIYGAHFAKNLSDNQVFIGGVPAPVLEGSTSQLTVQIPAAFSDQSPIWGLPVVVQVGSLKSTSNATFNVQTRVF